MEGYLGEFSVKSELSMAAYALLFIEKYGGFEADYHKAWVLDQVARILNGAEVTVTEARWENGHKELRYRVGTSDQYEKWVIEMCDGEDGPDTYDYDVGTPP